MFTSGQGSLYIFKNYLRVKTHPVVKFLKVRPGKGNNNSHNVKNILIFYIESSILSSRVGCPSWQFQGRTLNMSAHCTWVLESPSKTIQSSTAWNNALLKAGRQSKISFSSVCGFPYGRLVSPSKWRRAICIRAALLLGNGTQSTPCGGQIQR